MTSSLRVVLDTNVLISAIVFGGKPKEILLLSRHKKINSYSSVPILLELSDKLSNKFDKNEEMIRETISTFSKFTTIIYPKIKLRAVKADSTDNKIVNCAVEAKVDYIVTGDRHLLNINKYKGIEIVTPSRFLKLFGKKSG